MGRLLAVDISCESAGCPIDDVQAFAMATQRIDVSSGRLVRRQYTDDEKVRLVEAAFAPGVRPADYGRDHGVNRSLLHRWRRELLADQQPISAFTPVTVMVEEASAGSPVSTTVPLSAPSPTGRPPGWIEVELHGRVRVKIVGTVDPVTVSTTLTALAGRQS